MAKIVRAITQRSVLLSTKIKNAHIPLHNQSNKVAHQVANDIHLAASSSSFFGIKKSNTSFINNNQNIKHNGHDKKFIETAIVSGANQLPLNTEPILNQKDMKVCHKKGILFATHIFHHINQ